MNNFKRRDFIKLMGISTAAVATPSIIKAATGSVSPRVVVVGSGFAGSTVAKHLRMWSNNSIDVTVVDPKSAHVSCVMSNLVINGQLNMSDITFENTLLRQKYGVKFIQSSVTEIVSNSGVKTIALANGTILSCDFVVLAPGIAFDDILGLDHNKVPHAWVAGPQTELLRDQLQAIPAGGTFIMTVPKAPFRCPPGPYERACVVADIMKRKGGGKVVVLDMNSKIIVEEHMFSTAFSGIYGDILEYIPNVSIQEVDSDNLTIHTTIGSGLTEVERSFDADVLNVIPTHRAGKIISHLGFNSISGRWADVNPISYELNTEPGVYVIGDSSGTSQPKSGHMANSQAKICADAIIRMIANQPLDSQERLSNLTTNSACYSPITFNTATWLTAGFTYDQTEHKMKAIPASLGQAEQHTKDHYKDMFSWSQNLFENTFM
jgi:NADPH-dependent 2,4-dienoyl-CoA reductase/sulfur reductase-like enzyme